MVIGKKRIVEVRLIELVDRCWMISESGVRHGNVRWIPHGLKITGALIRNLYAVPEPVLTVNRM